MGAPHVNGADTAPWILGPGAETDDYFPATSGNGQDVFYYQRQYRMRPGSHHLIVTVATGSTEGRRLGGTQNSSKDNPSPGLLAPENEGIGMALDANTALTVNLHHINTTGDDILREAWINFWYVPEEEVTQQTREMFSMGGLGMYILPGEHTILGPYTCPVTEPGRILTMYGHRHASTSRFTAWRQRDGELELIYESLDWLVPLVVEFNSVTENTAPDRDKGVEGSWSGILDLKVGDSLIWECDVTNEQDSALQFTNQAFLGEMCILVGDTIGPAIACNYD